MSKKEKFIDEITKMLEDSPEKYLSAEALDYWNGIIKGCETDKPQFTPNGKLILQYMRDHKDEFNNVFKAKEVGEGLGISSRTASGSMRKLVTDGFIEKIGSEPVVYAITTTGLEANLNVD